MLLRKFRTKMTLFLWVCAAIFILFIFLEWGLQFTSTRRLTPQERGIIGKVNGVPILYQNYSNLVEQYRKRGLEPWECRELAFNTLIEEALVQGVLKERKIELTDQEVVEFIKNNPPPELVKDTMLQTDGKFDFNKYQSILSNPANTRWVESYETLIRREVPRQLLYQTITSAIRPTTVELVSAYIRENSKLEVEYAEIDSTQIEIGEEELIEYYNTHKDEFVIPGMPKMKYVVFNASPTTEDEIEVNETAKEIYELAKAGKALDSLAKESGYQILPADPVVDSLIGPVKKPDGFHIMKGDKDLHIPIRPSDETLVRVEESAINFIETAKNGFEEAAKSYGAEIYEIEWTSRSALQGVDLSYIDLKTKDKLIGPIEGENCFYVLYTLGTEKPHTPDFNEIKSQVNNKYWRYRAQELAQEWQKQINGAEFKEILSTKGMEIKIVRLEDTKIRKLKGEQDSLALQELFLKALNIPENGVATVSTDNGVYLVHCLKREEPTKEEIEKSLPEFTGEWMREEAEKTYTEWLNTLKHKAEIEDYRYKIY